MNIRAEDRGQGHPKDDHIAEETFCTNFLCCGVQLPDLHALLQHYEDVHVKIARERRQEGGEDAAGGDEEGEEEQELDVVGGVVDQAQVPQQQGKKPATQQQYLAAAEYRQYGGQRPDSVQSFGSVSAADALLGVGLPYAASNGPAGYPPMDRPRTAELGPPPPPGYGGYYGGYYPPPPMYYPPPQQQRGEQPVSAFDTTILRSVSPYPGGPAPPYYHPEAMQMMYHHPAYAMMQHPSGIQSMPAGPLHPMQQAQMYQQYQLQQMQQQTHPAPKRPRSAINPSIKAVAHASTTLRESLPSALAGQKDQFKMVYNILSNTIENPNRHGGDDDGQPSAAEALLAMDPKGKMSATAAAVLALPRAPIDKTLERPYICPVPGCGKAYKNPNGLKYHAAHGHDAAQEAVERPYKCPYGDCGNRYKNPNGLKYHVNKHHADMLPKSAVLAKAANAAKEAAASTLIDFTYTGLLGPGIVAFGTAADGKEHQYDEDEDAHDCPGSEDDGNERDEEDDGQGDKYEDVYGSE